MAVTAEIVAETRRLADQAPDTGELDALSSLPEVFGYAVELARAEGIDEADAAELIARGAELSRDQLRQSAPLLHRLGYVAVAHRLRHLARRKRCC